MKNYVFINNSTIKVLNVINLIWDKKHILFLNNYDGVLRRLTGPTQLRTTFAFPAISSNEPSLLVSQIMMGVFSRSLAENKNGKKVKEEINLKKQIVCNHAVCISHG